MIENKVDVIHEDENDVSRVLIDVKYICKSNSLITESLQKGCDITQMPNGDIIVTETKVVNTQYSWDKKKEKMVRTAQY
jgi:hypothetical protein